MLSDDIQDVWSAYLDRLRVWGVQAVLAAWALPESWDDVDAAAEEIGPLVTALYAAASAAALDSTDQAMGLTAAAMGADYAADWRKGRPLWPTQLPSGQSVAQWMSLTGPGIKRLIGDGQSLADAVAISRARAVQAVAGGPMQQARSTSFNRFLVDALLDQGQTPPAQLRPWVDEVEGYANLWDGRRRREPGSVWQRWQRVPSPGACKFCLMLATRSDYTSADAAIYAGGAEGTVRREERGGGRVNRIGLAGVSRRRSNVMESGERYHKSCRCTVRMVAKGSPAAISPEDFDRLSTPLKDGSLPTFGKGNYRYTVDAFDWDTEATGIPLPPVAPWKDAWKTAPYKPKRRTPQVAGAI